MKTKNNFGEVLGTIAAVLVVLALLKDYVSRWEVAAVWIVMAAVSVGLYWAWMKITGKE